MTDASRNPRGIRLEIGTLELTGFPVERRHAIADACAREIQRLLALVPHVDVTAKSQGIAAEPIRAPIDPLAPPGDVGISIAQAVVDALRSRR